MPDLGDRDRFPVGGGGENTVAYVGVGHGGPEVGEEMYGNNMIFPIAKILSASDTKITAPGNHRFSFVQLENTGSNSAFLVNDEFNITQNWQNALIKRENVPLAESSQLPEARTIEAIVLDSITDDGGGQFTLVATGDFSYLIAGDRIGIKSALVPLGEIATILSVTVSHGELTTIVVLYDPVIPDLDFGEGTVTACPIIDGLPFAVVEQSGDDNLYVCSEDAIVASEIHYLFPVAVPAEGASTFHMEGPIEIAAGKTKVVPIRNFQTLRMCSPYGTTVEGYAIITNIA